MVQDNYKNIKITKIKHKRNSPTNPERLLMLYVDKPCQILGVLWFLLMVIKEETDRFLPPYFPQNFMFLKLKLKLHLCQTHYHWKQAILILDKSSPPQSLHDGNSYNLYSRYQCCNT